MDTSALMYSNILYLLSNRIEEESSQENDQFHIQFIIVFCFFLFQEEEEADGTCQ